MKEIIIGNDNKGDLTVNAITSKDFIVEQAAEKAEQAWAAYERTTRERLSIVQKLHQAEQKCKKALQIYNRLRLAHTQAKQAQEQKIAKSNVGEL